MGRPTLYSLELAAEICARIATGESLNKILKDNGMPDTVTVYRWLAIHEDFRHMYTLAREDQGETHADLIVDLADEDPVQVVDDKGVARVDSAWVNWQRNRIDARKWVASKLKPRKYGDKIGVDHSGGFNLTVSTGIPDNEQSDN